MYIHKRNVYFTFHISSTLQHHTQLHVHVDPGNGKRTLLSDFVHAGYSPAHRSNVEATVMINF